ncbi:uncharacterized protein N7483_007337 [Penicillium malachiteum]|uniref:uncharacterized protein n=1 Tax=Penicillium malachiteum TaxID=1324776 RepID=UPI00254865C8|nr:uncharacterized protein N7483_007337 [Penicillium malachiteum]KAJ5725980.1 hypothetical protein N7483_007337 [Penicillium malachiteum]
MADAFQFLLGLIGASQCTSYNGLMVARVFQGLGSGVCESLPVQLVNDIFFIHERGKKIDYYTICPCLGSTGPLYAGYMLGGGYSWRLFFYVEAAFAAAVLVMAFLFVEESTYHRETQPTPDLSLTDSLDIGEKDIKLNYPQLSFHASIRTAPMRKSYFSTLKPWSDVDHDAEFTMTMLRSFTYFLVPAVSGSS